LCAICERLQPLALQDCAPYFWRSTAEDDGTLWLYAREDRDELVLIRRARTVELTVTSFWQCNGKLRVQVALRGHTAFNEQFDRNRGCHMADVMSCARQDLLLHDMIGRFTTLKYLRNGKVVNGKFKLKSDRKKEAWCKFHDHRKRFLATINMPLITKYFVKKAMV
jgi:hypothetical protein